MSTIQIIDFGGQYVHLIATRLSTATTKIVVTNKYTKMDDLAGIILSGGPKDDVPIIDIEAMNDVPILGICYGYQLIGKYYGARIVRNDHSEYGKTSIIPKVNNSSSIIPENTKTVWMSHSNYVEWNSKGTEEWKGTEVNNNIEVLAETVLGGAACAIKIRNREIYAVQFHPEVSDTDNGRQILSNFLARCSINNSSITTSIIDNKTKIISSIRRTTIEESNSKVLIAVSGGVDSTVVAALMKEAIGADRLKCVFIDTGLLRETDTEYVKHLFKNILSIPLLMLDHSHEFYDALHGVSDPQEKRSIIGRLFGEIFERYQDTNDVTWLAQGTIYPDRIESGSAGNESKCIKTHHNMSLPENMKLKLIEPIRDLYKDGVRRLAKQLGIPDDVANRQPFPGPGLAIRVVGAVTRERIMMVRQADTIMTKMLRESDPEWYDEHVWQSYVALLATTKTVGVKGDNRSYEHPMVIRIVRSVDAMTAQSIMPTSATILFDIASEIVNQVDGCNRVFFDLTNKPPGTIELE